MTITFVAVAGLAAVIRYLFSVWNKDLPWGTLFVNNLAVFLIPFILLIDSGLNQILLIGFAGSLSTVSTFSLEIVKLNSSFRIRYSILTLVTCLASYQLANLLAQ